MVPLLLSDNIAFHKIVLRFYAMNKAPAGYFLEITAAGPAASAKGEPADHVFFSGQKFLTQKSCFEKPIIKTRVLYQG